MSHEGSPSDQIGITSEVASVIREFTEPTSEDGDIYYEGKSNGDFVRCTYFYVPCSCMPLLIWIVPKWVSNEFQPLGPPPK